MKTVFAFLGIFCCISLATANNEITGQVVTVIDGNTLEVVTADNDTYKVFLLGIDCPELRQIYGDKAKECLEKLVLQKNVRVILKGKDRQGNYLGIVTVNGEIDPRVNLLKEGLAWTTEDNLVPELESYKSVAQQKNKGLWTEKDPTPPWIFRRQQSMLQPKSR